MADAAGEAGEPPLRVAFDRRLNLEFHSARITSNGGLLVYREHGRYVVLRLAEVAVPRAPLFAADPAARRPAARTAPAGGMT